MDVFTYLVDMPDGFRGHCNPNPDGSYSIFINAKLNIETQKEAYMHELMHICNNDFEKFDADKIEYTAHKEGYI